MAQKTIQQLQPIDELELSHLIPVDTGTQTFKVDVQKVFDLVLATLPLVSTGALDDDAVTSDKLKDSVSTDADRAVTTDHIRDFAVTAEKLRSSVGTDGDRAVTTDHIKNGAVTPAKLSALGEQISATCGDFATSAGSGTYADVTNLSVTITTTGRPVFITLISGSTTDLMGSIGAYAGGSANPVAYFSINRGGSGIATYTINANTASGSVVSSPCGGILYIDTPAAGTYTYKIQAKTGGVGGSQAMVRNCKLAVFEL